MKDCFIIYTELERINREFDSLAEAIDWGEHNIPGYMDWEVRDWFGERWYTTVEDNEDEND